MAHGFAGDKDEKGLFIAARDFFAGTGFSVLRFDFRGCGESEGDFRTIRLSDLADDLISVSKFTRKCLDGKSKATGVVYFSLAAGVSVLAGGNQFGAHAFWSPAVYTGRDVALRYRTADVENQIAQNGWFEKSGLLVGKQFLDDLGSNLIENSLENFHRPALIVHGNNDQRIPVTSSEGLMRHLPASSRLIIIPDADHSFRAHPSHREWLFSATAAWLSKQLCKASKHNLGNQTRLFEADPGAASSSSTSRPERHCSVDFGESNKPSTNEAC